MPRKQKINLEKVAACLNTVCPKCGYPNKLLFLSSRNGGMASASSENRGTCPFIS
jgi:hypothetical protein